MIAPYRETDPYLEADAQIMARARRAVAMALLGERSAEVPSRPISHWRVWLCSGWALLVAGASIGGIVAGWWQRIDY